MKSFGGAGSSYHDSTNLLQHLVKRNGQLPTQVPDAMGVLGPGGPPVDGEVDRAVQNLRQINYDLIYGSSSTSVTQGSSGRRGLVVGARPVHSFLRNLPRKEGRVRANMLGGRVFYISRSTISGNMRYRVDEVGVPLEFARTLQVEEEVQEFNRDWLMPFFLNGRRQYPGCTHLVRRATREVHDVANLRDARLEVGDILYRDTVNGDFVYFNRQPTLERSSFGVHRAVVIQDASVHTFRMNVLACEWYNADFDGDQMNLWVVRGPGPRAEAFIMSSVANWFISTKTAAPSTGRSRTRSSAPPSYAPGVVVDKYHAMALFAATGVEPPASTRPRRPRLHRPRGRVPPARPDARQLPPRPQQLQRRVRPVHRLRPQRDPHRRRAGRLVRGVLDKRAIGGKVPGSIFHLISREYGSQRALDVIYALQQVALQFLLFRGFTVGTADLLPSPEALRQIRALVSGVGLESRVITDRLLRGEIIPPIGSTTHEFYEKSQLEALKVNEGEIIRWVLGSIRPASNGFFRMIAVGAKGNNPNLIHVSGVIGQTTINVERITEQFAFRRTSPYFPRFATEPAAYGFVANSYIDGHAALRVHLPGHERPVRPHQQGPVDRLDRLLHAQGDHEQPVEPRRQPPPRREGHPHRPVPVRRGRARQPRAREGRVRDRPLSDRALREAAGLDLAAAAPPPPGRPPRSPRPSAPSTPPSTGSARTATSSAASSAASRTRTSATSSRPRSSCPLASAASSRASSSPRRPGRPRRHRSPSPPPA